MLSQAFLQWLNKQNEGRRGKKSCQIGMPRPCYVAVRPIKKVEDRAHNSVTERFTK